jgi:hypothetical protein
MLLEQLLDLILQLLENSKELHLNLLGFNYFYPKIFITKGLLHTDYLFAIFFSDGDCFFEFWNPCIDFDFFCS